MLDKDTLVNILEAEIDGREDAFNEGACEQTEINDLRCILNCVKEELTLSFAHYSWLCDLVETHIVVREEE